MKNNKILIIVLAIVLVVSVGVGSYFIFDSIYNKEPETNNDLNNQTGNNNNINNGQNNNNGIEKTSLEILNDLVNRGYLKESNSANKYTSDDPAYINKKGQFIIRNMDDNKNITEIVAEEIDGKVSQADMIIRAGAVYSFLVITDEGNLYSQNNNNRYGDEYTNIHAKRFEKIVLPSKVKKIYKGGVDPIQYYVLLKNNDVYELKITSNSSTDLELGNMLNENTFIEDISVSSLQCADTCPPILKFTYNGKTYFDNTNSIYEIKDTNNNSINTKFAISNIHDNMSSNELYSYVDAYIVDVNNDVYVISKISENNDGEHKTNTNVKKYSNKKVKSVLSNPDEYKVTITYEDGSKETVDGYFVEVIK